MTDISLVVRVMRMLYQYTFICQIHSFDIITCKNNNILIWSVCVLIYYYFSFLIHFLLLFFSWFYVSSLYHFPKYGAVKNFLFSFYYFSFKIYFLRVFSFVHIITSIFFFFSIALLKIIGVNVHIPNHAFNVKI